MSLLANQTNVSPSNYFFALSGAGPGSNVSSFNTLTTSTFTVSTIVNPNGESKILMDKITNGLHGITVSTLGQVIVTASTAITLFSPNYTEIIAGRIPDEFGNLSLQASTISIQRNISSGTIIVPTNIVSLGCGVLTNFSSMTISSINTNGLSGNNASVSSVTVSSITVDTPASYISHNSAASTLVLANTENGVSVVAPAFRMSANTNLTDGVSTITFAQLLSSVRG